jgi:phage terminase large subunit-like protein
MEEVAAMRHLEAALDHTALGLRIGTHPHYIMSTTPKPRREIKALVRDPKTILTKGTTSEAYHLDPAVRDAYFERYAGTRLGRQELDAEILDDLEGALWSTPMIDADRVPGYPQLDRIVVAVDPPGVSTVHGRECGIVVVGRAGNHAFVLEDVSGEYSPAEWAGQAVRAVRRWNADAIVAETNYGGEMVISTLRSVPGSSDIPIRPVVARGSKAQRAEPVVALYEQHRVHHVGVLTELETQQTEWLPEVTSNSPDRVDALVHAVRDLLVHHGESKVSSPVGRRFTGSSAVVAGPRRVA